MDIPSCTSCNRPAAWRRPGDGEFLCIAHFNYSFIRRIQRTINKYKLLTRNDVIAIGLSGGKDSVVLLDVMVKLQVKHPTKLIAISIDEGIANYREDGLRYARLAAERAGIEHHIFSYKEKFGYDLDDALVLLGPQRLGACSTCGPFRRKSLNEAAREVGATKLAVGHNADDESQTLLMNLMRGDLLKSLHSNPRPKFKQSSFVNRVKPLRRTSEQEIVLYANFNGLPYQEMPCPYAVEAYRGRIRDMLTDFQEHDPAVINSIIKSADSLFSLADQLPNGSNHGGNKPILQCTNCNEPSNSKLCKTCTIVEKIKNSTIIL